MKKFFLTMLLATFLISCDDFPDDDTDEFYAVDFTDNSFYKVKAERLIEGRKCVIWAERGSGITQIKAGEIADKYDNVIRPKIVDAFGMKEIDDMPNGDILDYANQLAGKQDRKLTILLLDIKDNFNEKTNPSYVAGYFYSGNFYRRDNSNGCDMIYVDTNPGLSKKPEDTYATFAHELQHLINFATTTLKREKAMDTWIDEGLSSQAEHIYFEKNIEEHCVRFSKDDKGTIAKGNNFFVWDNHPEEPMAILDEYSTVYLFFRWLYLQADDNLKSSIFLDIETSNLSDHRVITNVASKINDAWADWDTLLRSWLAANYYPANSSYGYKDSYFQERIKVKPITVSSIKLAPGEGVYSSIKEPFSPQAGGTNIRYAGLLPGSSSSIVPGPLFDSGVLLTYNANTNNKSTAETGYLTGVTASVSSPSNSRMVTEDAQTETHTGPYVIDARDYARIFGRSK